MHFSLDWATTNAVESRHASRRTGRRPVLRLARSGAGSIADLRRSRRSLPWLMQLHLLDLDGVALRVLHRDEVQLAERGHVLLADVPEDAGVLARLVVKTVLLAADLAQLGQLF